jgi:tetratricopeptide (TPR) repeat protein/tRNA A-37 threonylcarbamoyl transferase component Bud32
MRQDEGIVFYATLMIPPDEREEWIIRQARERPAAERAAFLDGACVGDDALRQRLEAQLAAHNKPDEPPPAAAATIKLDLTMVEDQAVGTTIGRYKLMERIGEGGCGVVYVAEQTAPVRRRVALKVIKQGMDTKQVVARFEAERQALAMMDHANIAKVLDAGATETGRPFFVMELVRGIRITDYCDQNNLTTKERLALFIKVCQAIQHAHQKGIIHRDIKPSNILVTLHDGVPVPKVIDFGIAKATEGRLTDNTVYTQLNQFIGTPAYMSPEQAEMSGLDIDTRSDIYSLGVLLYELLTGTPPFDPHLLVVSGLDAMRKTIRESEPVRPSTRFATLRGEELTTTAKRRSTEISKLLHQLKGDLDWIVMKCLEKDRTRRYDTAIGLAMDLQRHLGNEPVVARPPTTMYRLQKLMRRNKVAFAAATAIALSLVVGLAASLWQAARARESAAEASAVLQFLQDRILAATRPQGQEGGLGREVTIHKAVDTAAPLIADSFKGKPTVEASIRISLGMTYKYLGQTPEAIQQLSRAVELRTASLGSGDSNTLESRTALGEAYFDAGRDKDAIALLEPSLKLAERKLGQDNPVTISIRNDLAMSYSTVGRSSEAIALHEANLKVAEAMSGPDSAQTLTARNNLALAYWNANRIKDAVALDEVNLKIRESKLGLDSPLTLTSRNNLALEYNAVGRANEAIAMLETNLQLRRAKLGPDHPDSISSENSVAAVYWVAGRIPEATALLEEALKRGDSTAGPDHPTTLVTKSLLAEAYGAGGQPDKVEPLLRDVLARSQKKFGPDDPRTGPALAQLGGWLVNHGKPIEAEPMLRQCLAIREKLEPDNWTTFNTRSQFGGSLLGQGRYAEAEPLILEGYEGLKAREQNILPQGKIRLPEAAQRVVELYEKWGKPDKAAEWRAKLAGPSQASAPKQ